MGKLITQIAQVAAVAGLTALTGGAFGVAVGLTSGLAIGTSMAIGTALATVAAAAAVSGISSLLGLGPSLPKPDTSAFAIKVPRPPRVSGYGISRLYWAWSLFETASNGTAVDVGAVHDGKMDGLIGFYLNDDPVTLTGNIVDAGDDKRYQDSAVSLYYTDGSTPGAPFSAIIALMPGIWTEDHRGDGVVMLAQTAKPVKSKKYLETYPNQVPVPSMVARWQLCPDPFSANPGDPSGWTWTENPVRQLMHYKLVREGIDYATKIAPTLAYWRAAATICDELIALKVGGTEPRYRSWLAHKHTDRHSDVVAALLSTFDGWIAPRADGALVVYAGKYYTPTVSIGPADIVGYDWNGVGVDDNTAVNEIVCSYISADHDYNSVETDAWRDEDDIAERGQILSNSLDPQVPSWGQVRRLAKRKMDRANTLYRGTITANGNGRAIRGQRYIAIDLTDAGTTFFQGIAEVTNLTRNLMTGGVTLSWVAANPNIDTWNPVTEEGNPAAKGDRVAQEPLETPTILSATADFSDIGESGGIGGGTVTGVRIIIEAEGPDRDDLTWYARWRVGSGAWSENSYTDVDPGAGVELITDYVPYGTMVEVAVSYSSGGGLISDWSASESVDTSP